MADLNFKKHELDVADELKDQYMSALQERGYRVKHMRNDEGVEYFRITHPEWDYDVESKTFFLNRPYTKTKSRFVQLYGGSSCMMYADHGINTQRVLEAAELYEEVYNIGQRTWDVVIER